MTNDMFPASISRRSLLASTAICLLMSSVPAGAFTIGQGMPWAPGTARPPAAMRDGRGRGGMRL
jgi:hypothetical protein